MVAGTIVVMVLLALFLNTKFWPAGLGLERQESIAPPDGQAVASRPVPAPVPAPTAPATALTAPTIALEEDIPAEEIPAPSPQSRASQLDPPAEAQRATTTPDTSVERMAMFLVGRDGPERAAQTALAVATFYPVNTDDFKYWHRVAAAIRASTAPKEESGEAVRR